MLHEQMYFYGNEVNIQTSILMTDQKKKILPEKEMKLTQKIYILTHNGGFFLSQPKQTHKIYSYEKLAKGT